MLVTRRGMTLLVPTLVTVPPVARIPIFEPFDLFVALKIHLSSCKLAANTNRTELQLHMVPPGSWTVRPWKYIPSQKEAGWSSIPIIIFQGSKELSNFGGNQPIKRLTTQHPSTNHTTNPLIPLKVSSMFFHFLSTTYQSSSGVFGPTLHANIGRAAQVQYTMIFAAMTIASSICLPGTRHHFGQNLGQRNVDLLTKKQGLHLTRKPWPLSQKSWVYRLIRI